MCAAGKRLVRPPAVEERDQDGGCVVRRGGRVQPGHRALGGDFGIGQARAGASNYYDTVEAELGQHVTSLIGFAFYLACHGCASLEPYIN